MNPTTMLTFRQQPYMAPFASGNGGFSPRPVGNIPFPGTLSGAAAPFNNSHTTAFSKTPATEKPSGKPLEKPFDSLQFFSNNPLQGAFSGFVQRTRMAVNTLIAKVFGGQTQATATAVQSVAAPTLNPQQLAIAFAGQNGQKLNALA